MSTETFDAIIIGTGQAGKPLATALAGAGKRTAILERQHVGGSCINFGCTPTKTMVATARVAHLARRGPDYGVETGAVSVDLERVRERKRAIVEMFRKGGTRGLEKADGVELIRGHGRFTGPRELAVELRDGTTRRLTAERVFLHTGARPFVPPIEGLEEVPFLDSTSVMELGEVPDRLLVLGGGVIGLEFGQMFRRFGAAVTIVQRGDQLLPGQDRDVAEALREILEEDGVEVLVGHEATSARSTGDGQIELEVGERSGGRLRRLTGRHLLVAAGRRPNTDDLGLETAGVETDAKGFVRVDSGLRTTVDGVYALGDCNGGPAFTHVSYDDFRVVRANLLEGGDASTEGRLVPFTLFTDPQLGRVGMTEEEARRWGEETGREIRVAKLPMSHVARALETDETRGLMKAVVDGETERILGCAILGIEGGEVMAVLQMAMLGDVPYPAIRDGIFAHPTLAESLNNLFTRLEG